MYKNLYFEGSLIWRIIRGIIFFQNLKQLNFCFLFEMKREQSWNSWAVWNNDTILYSDATVTFRI